MKLEKTIILQFKKGKIYNLAENDPLIPKEEYSKYFQNTDEAYLTDDGEWMAEDLCIKSVKVEVKLYS